MGRRVTIANEPNLVATNRIGWRTAASGRPPVPSSRRLLSPDLDLALPVSGSSNHQFNVIPNPTLMTPPFVATLSVDRLMRRFLRVAAVAILSGTLIRAAGPAGRSMDLREVLSARRVQLGNLRAAITHHLDHGVSRSVDTSVLERNARGDMASVAFSSESPSDQTLYFYRSGLLVRYGSAIMKPDGDVGPLRDNTLMFAAVTKTTDLLGSLDRELLQLDVAYYLPEGPVVVEEDGRFAYPKQEGSPVVSGRFDAVRGVLLSVEFLTAQLAWANHYAYTAFTNIGGITLPLRSEERAEFPGGRSESWTEFAYSPLPPGLPVMTALVPPTGCEVSDERFTPFVSYIAEKRGYSEAELAAKWSARQSQTPEKPPEPASRLAASPFQFAMLFGVAGVIGLALRRLAVARRSPKGDGTRV